MSSRNKKELNAEEVRKRAAKLSRYAAKGVAKELGEISKGVLSELFKLATLQKK
jgi:hypothetical protein